MMDIAVVLLIRGTNEDVFWNRDGISIVSVTHQVATTAVCYHNYILLPGNVITQSVHEGI